MLDGVPIVQLTPGILLGVGILAILTGRLVPRRTYDDVKEDRDSWRAAHQLSEHERVIVTEQMKELLEHAKTTNAIIRALPHAAEEGET